MTPEALAAYVALGVAIASGVYQFVLFSTKFARLTLQVETMWSFLVRRGQAEAVRSGIATLNSPIVMGEEAKGWMAHMASELRELRIKLGTKINDEQLAFEIEKVFGERILKEVCIPHGLMLGACLQIAVAVAKEEPPIGPI